METPRPTPFDQAWQYIHHNDGGAAEALAKLSLSFWDYYKYPYTLPECIGPLDSERRRIARDMVNHFFEHGAGEPTRRHAKDIIAKYPNLKRRGKKPDTPDVKADIADLLWKLKRILAQLGPAVARHEFDDAHAETGRLADTIEHYEKTHPDHAV
ncbi:MAG: hypothetical protein LBT97_02900 [Planctomycetota bacterium]|jgi:hypothetical protein|nr:hypothetical protein [Planctomycetota bacterium]